MEIASCMVMLNGERDNVVFKSEVTPAEYQVLRRVHGESGVNPITDVKFVRDEMRLKAEEMERLKANYGIPGHAKDREGEPVRCPVSQIFGEFSGGGNLPVTFGEIGVEVAKPEVQKAK